jgi:hypothetical protein
MPDASSKPHDPPPVRLGRLRTPSAIRCACTRIGNAVLAGKLDPRKANSALYAVAGAKSAMDLEQQAKVLELEQQRVNIEAARAKTGRPTSVTSEDVLAAWRAPALAAPAPQPARAAIASPVPPAVTPREIASPAPSQRAHEVPSDESQTARAPRPPREEPPIDVQPDAGGVWVAPSEPAQPHGVTILGEEPWRRVPADMKEIAPEELERVRQQIRRLR